MYCLTCTEPVCLTCIADKTHRNHELDKLANIAEKYKRKLSEFIKETKQDISDCQTSLQSIHNNIQDYNKLADKTISDINQQRQQIKSEADKVADDMIRKLEQRKLQDVNTMKEEGDKVKKIISDDKELLRPCEEKLQSDIDTSVKDFKTVLSFNKKKSPFSVTSVRPPVFVRTDVHGLQDIFGSLEDQKEKVGAAGGRIYNPDEEPTQRPEYKPTSVNISTVVVSHINPGKPSSVVCAASDRNAWYGCGLGNGKELVLVQTDGTVKKRVKLDHDVYDITVTMSGDLLFSKFNGSTIRQYSQDKITVVSNTGSYKTRGICTTSKQQLLVCLHKSENDNKVVRMSLNGQIKQTIQYNKQNKPLFSSPTSVTENINEDICVVDSSCTVVVVVNKDGEFRFKYPESDKSTHTIGSCCGIACDKLGYILISDLFKNQIQQLNMNGKFVQLVLTKQNGIYKPWGLTVDDEGRLWVCNENYSEVTIYKYRS